MKRSPLSFAISSVILLDRKKWGAILEKLSIYEKPVRMGNMLAFTLPTMILMIFTSLYMVVDGIVVSNYVGSLGLSAINIVYPLLNISMAVGFMLATGSNAVIAKKLGEGKGQEANRFMSLVTILTIGLMVLLAVLFLCWDEQLYRLLGSDDILMPYCIDYGKIVVPGGVFMSLQVLFQSYLVTADRPRLGLALTVGGGVLNIVLDILLVGPLQMGVAGAAIASVLGQAVASLIPLALFFNKNWIIHFEKPVWNPKELAHSMGNGASEMVTNLANAVTTALYNLQMMALVGEKGVAAISAILYLVFIFVAIFVGFTAGIEPVVSYNYGAKNHGNLQKLFRISVTVICVFSVAMLAASEALNRPMVMIFASKDGALQDLMTGGFRILAVSFLFSGVNIFASSFFTALSNGKVSALISLLRTFVFEAGALLLLPHLLGLPGVWMALPAAEFLSAIVSIALLVRYRKVYHY